MGCIFFSHHSGGGWVIAFNLDFIEGTTIAIKRLTSEGQESDKIFC